MREKKNKKQMAAIAWWSRLREVHRKREFRLPSVILILIGTAWLLDVAPLWRLATAVGLIDLVWRSARLIRVRRFDLDYIAILALILALWLDELAAGGIIALMVTMGEALEKYGTERAEKTLRGLFDTLPKTVLVRTDGQWIECPIQSVGAGTALFVRPGEMVALDGILDSEHALLNEANLTGEMEPETYAHGAKLTSGFVNAGEAFEMTAMGDFEHSSYRNILRLVEEGKKTSAPLLRLAGTYNYLFTFATLALAAAAYVVSGGSWDRLLAVLVIATPCPLLIAAPISFLGGLNRAARNNIIIKSPFVLELLAKTKIFLFDKTGTLTLGEPEMKRIEVMDASWDEVRAFEIAASLERHSLHPIAKSIVAENRRRGGRELLAEGVEEKIGRGISGAVGGHWYRIAKAEQHSPNAGIVIDVIENGKTKARFFFDDIIKDGAGEVFSYLRSRGYRLGMLTGDRKENAERLFGRFGFPVYAECSPERKIALVKRHQRGKNLVAMIGDGMNDAPALALADLGIVFSGSENSASIEAADVAILGRDVSLVRTAVHIGRKAYRVAGQSMALGIGLSTVGMFFAAAGFIQPALGAILQEGIDVLVIVNALRSTY